MYKYIYVYIYVQVYMYIYILGCSRNIPPNFLFPNMGPEASILGLDHPKRLIIVDS